MNNQSFEEFMRVWGAIKTCIYKISDESGLTMRQTALLYSLHHKGTSSMSALADDMHCDASNITEVVKRLTKQGFVDLHTQSEDKRQKQLCLTQKGVTFISTIMRSIHDKVGFSNLTKHQADQLTEILQKLKV